MGKKTFTLRRILILLSLTAILISGCTIIEADPLHGEWTATLFDIEETVTFKESTVKMENPLDGVRIYSYSIDGESITLTNLDTENTFNREFKVLGDYEAIKIDGIIYER
jgi:hypothetical protein